MHTNRPIATGVESCSSNRHLIYQTPSFCLRHSVPEAWLLFRAAQMMVLKSQNKGNKNKLGEEMREKY